MMSTNSKLLLSGIMIALVFAVKGYSQSGLARLDSLYQVTYNNGEFNGNVLVAENGKVVYQKAFGFANIEKRIYNRNDSRSELGSVSKLFTSVAILQLKEKGLLHLTDPVTRYLPQFPYPSVTIKHLLTHTSGLPDFEIFDSAYQQNPHKLFLNEDVIPAIKAYGRLLFNPGDRWSYSSPGMALLASIVEAVSKQPFEEYIRRNVLKPAGMKNTYIQSLAHPVSDTGRVENYAPLAFFSTRLIKTDTSKRHIQFSQVSGALLGPGLLVSDKGDLLKFDQALYSHKLLQEATLQEAFTSIKLNNGQFAHPDPFLGNTNFGLGWFILEDNPCGKMVLHTGKHAGIVTIFVRNITRQQTLVMFDNTESAGLNTTALNTLNIINDQPLVMRKRSLGRQYVQELFANGPDYAASCFNALKSDTSNWYFNNQEMDYGGHQLLSSGYTQLGLETLKLLTLIQPSNTFSYFSYAKGLLEAGKKTEAVMMCKKSLSLDKENREAMQLWNVLEGN